ncbi:hypothetical protein O5D80_005001 [Batrachochytrium dendrobatidis]|nr:hypothetical protein O5D80_005001 [Batrachochytrium dendrobatidis]
MQIVGPIVFLTTGLAFISLLVSLHEPVHPIATTVTLIDIKAALPSDSLSSLDKSYHVGLMPSLNRSLLLWSLSQGDDIRNPKSRLISQRLFLDQFVKTAPQKLFSIQNHQLIDLQNIHVITNDTFNESTKYILTDDAGSHLPTITLVTNTVHEEESVYYARVYAIETPSNSDPGSYKFVQAQVPGSLTFSRLSYGVPHRLVYSRKSDARLFRIIDNLVPLSTPRAQINKSDDVLKSPSVPFKSLPGPLFETFPGRILSIVPLFTKNSLETLIFIFQYKSLPNTKLFKIHISLFHCLQGSEWEKRILWEKDWHGLGEDTIAADELHLLYFLTDPVVVTSRFSKVVSFVFMKQIFTLDYVGDDTEKQFDGPNLAFDYVLSWQKIHLLSGSEMEINNMHIDTFGQTLVLSNKRNQVFILKRALKTKPIDQFHTDPVNAEQEMDHATNPNQKLHESTEGSQKIALQSNTILSQIGGYVDLFLSSPEVSQFFMEMFWDQSIADLIDDSHDNISSPLFGEWELKGYWNSADYAYQAPTTIEAVTLLESTDHDFVIVLLGKSHIAVLDYDRVYKGRHITQFIRRHAILVMALVFITAMFSINEFRPDLVPRSNGIFITMLYLLLFSVILSVMVEEI